MWTIKSAIQSNFSFSNDYDFSSLLFLDERIKRINISSNSLVDSSKLEITFSTNNENIPTSMESLNTASEIVNIFINFLSFITGESIKLVEPISLLFNTPGTNNFTNIIIGESYVSPKEITLHTINSNDKIAFTPKIHKVLYLLQQGLDETSLYYGLQYLITATEIISSNYQSSEIAKRICKKCGYEEKIQPSMREKFIAFLISTNLFNMDSAKDAWKARNEMTHSVVINNQQRLYELGFLKNNIYKALIVGIKKELQIEDSKLPSENKENIFSDKGILAINYTTN